MFQRDKDEIDALARDLLQTLGEVDPPPTLAVYALCKAITMIGTQRDLDRACRIIDEMAEETQKEEVWDDSGDDDDDEWG